MTMLDRDRRQIALLRRFLASQRRRLTVGLGFLWLSFAFCAAIAANVVPVQLISELELPTANDIVLTTGRVASPLIDVSLPVPDLMHGERVTGTGLIQAPGTTNGAFGAQSMQTNSNLEGQNVRVPGQPAEVVAVAAPGSPVPEPTTWAMLLVGLGVVILRARSMGDRSSRIH